MIVSLFFANYLADSSAGYDLGLIFGTLFLNLEVSSIKSYLLLFVFSSVIMYNNYKMIFLVLISVSTF